MTAWHDRRVPDAAAQVRALLLPIADPTRAPAMAAYMKGVAPFLGVPAPARRAATRDWSQSLDPGPAGAALLGAARSLVEAPERELAYVAVDLADLHRRSLPATSLQDLRELALTVPWWDTVDAWAGVIGRTALRHPGWDAQVASWAVDGQLWARRIALVFQVGRRADLDLELLLEACRANLCERDFFLRKGIGWALRDAARTQPATVLAFVEQNRATMSPLSAREATKHLT